MRVLPPAAEYENDGGSGDGGGATLTASPADDHDGTSTGDASTAASEHGGASTHTDDHQDAGAEDKCKEVPPEGASDGGDSSLDELALMDAKLEALGLPSVNEGDSESASGDSDGRADTGGHTPDGVDLTAVQSANAAAWADILADVSSGDDEPEQEATTLGHDPAKVATESVNDTNSVPRAGKELPASPIATMHRVETSASLNSTPGDFEVAPGDELELFVPASIDGVPQSYHRVRTPSGTAQRRSSRRVITSAATQRHAVRMQSARTRREEELRVHVQPRPSSSPLRRTVPSPIARRSAAQASEQRRARTWAWWRGRVVTSNTLACLVCGIVYRSAASAARQAHANHTVATTKTGYASRVDCASRVGRRQATRR